MKQFRVLILSVFLLCLNTLFAQETDTVTELKELTINVAPKKYIINTVSKKRDANLISAKYEVLEKINFNPMYHGLHISRLRATIYRDYITYKNDKETKNYKIYLKICFYNENLEQTGSTDTIIFQQKKKNYLDIALKEKIEISKEPIYIGLEFVGIENNDGLFINTFDNDSEVFRLRPIFCYNDNMEDKLKTILYTRRTISKYELAPINLVSVGELERYGMTDDNYYFFSYEIQ